MASYRYIDHSELAALMRSGATAGRDYQVVDVRDRDFMGGNITGALNQPSEQRTEQSVQDLVTKLEAVPKVIFHCALSQVRGPNAARVYAEAKQAALPLPSTGATPSLPTAAEAASAFAPNPYAPTPSAVAAAPAQETQGGAEGTPTKKQEVLVLRDGFEGWQSLYRKDPLLVEKFDEAVWGGYAA